MSAIKDRKNEKVKPLGFFEKWKLERAGYCTKHFCVREARATAIIDDLKNSPARLLSVLKLMDLEYKYYYKPVCLECEVPKLIKRQEKYSAFDRRILELRKEWLNKRNQKIDALTNAATKALQETEKLTDQANDLKSNIKET